MPDVRHIFGFRPALERPSGAHLVPRPILSVANSLASILLFHQFRFDFLLSLRVLSDYDCQSLAVALAKLS